MAYRHADGSEEIGPRPQWQQFILRELKRGTLLIPMTSAEFRAQWMNWPVHTEKGRKHAS